MNKEQLYPAYDAWVETTGSSAQKSLFKNTIISPLRGMLGDAETVQAKCMPVPRKKPLSRRRYTLKYSRRARETRAQLWRMRGVGVVVLGECYDFFLWVAEQGEYDFSMIDFQTMFPQGRPGGAPKRD